MSRLAIADEQILATAYAENSRRTQATGRLQEIAAADNARRDSSASASQQRAGQFQARAEAENIKRTADEFKKAEQEANKTAGAFLRLGQTAGIVDGQVGSLARTTGTLTGGLGGIVSPAGLAAGAILAISVAAAKASYDLVKDMGEAEREIANLASRLGITVQEAEKLSAEARLTGVNISALESAARLLAEALENPTQGGKRAADALEKLGIKTIDLQGKIRETGPVVLQALDKLSKIPDYATRLALANEALGRGAKVLQPLIANYEELKRTVASLHIGEDEAGSKQLLEADKAVKQLSESWNQFKRTLAVEVSPIIIPILYKLSRGKADAQDNVDLLAFEKGNEPGVVAARKLSIERNIAPVIRKRISDSLADANAEAQKSLTTSGAPFRAEDDKTKESLEEQLRVAKKREDELRPVLRSDSISSPTRKADTEEYNKQRAEVERLEKAIENLNKAKHAPDEIARTVAQLG